MLDAVASLMEMAQKQQMSKLPTQSVSLTDTETVRAVTLVLLLQCLNDNKLTPRAERLQTVWPRTPDLQRSRRQDD